MGILNYLFGKRDTQPFNPLDDRWYSPMTTEGSATGVVVTPESAMRSAAVFACVKVISETVAGLPFFVYKRKRSGGREKDFNYPLYKILHDKPNKWMTSFEFREMLTAHTLLRGNAYAQKIYSKGGQLLELVPLDPTRMEVKINPDTGRVYYKYRTRMGTEREFTSEEIFHLKGYTSDGLVGMSPIAYASEAVGLSLATEEFGARLFSNDAKPGGILEHPAKLTDEAHERMKKSWQEAHAGLKNAHKVAILEEGMKWTKVGMSSQDSQFVESRRFQIEEIARIFRVPPHMIGDLTRATFSNIEHQAIEFVMHTILPWLKRWEQSINARLIADDDTMHYVEFLVDGLLRGDIKSRYDAYAVGRQWGWLSADDVRDLENQEPLPEKQGEMYLIPMNMVNAKEGGKPPEPKVVKETPDAKEEKPQPENKQARSLALTQFVPLLKDAVGKCVRREAKRLATARKKNDLADYIEDTRSFAYSQLSPILETFISTLAIIEGRNLDSITKQTASKVLVERYLEDWKAEAESNSELEEGKEDSIIDSRCEKFLVRVGNSVNVEELEPLRLSPTPVIQVRNEAPVVNLSVTHPTSTDKEVTWITDSEGKRKAVIREVQNG